MKSAKRKNYMRMKLYLVGALSLLVSVSTQARIGYALEQCIALYDSSAKLKYDLDL
jgi:hypothetical protein